MRTFFLQVPIILAFILVALMADAQAPCQNGQDGLIYIQGAGIQNYNPALPISATNPVLNTIPNGGSGLAVANNINGPGPSPTFYAVSGGNYIYWNGVTWVNTGHSAGAGGFVNPGGAGNFIYNYTAGGAISKYDGTGNATVLLTVPGFGNGGPFDVVGNCDGSFYVLRTDTNGNQPGFMRRYDPNGVLLQSWTVTGTWGVAGGGFSIVNNVVYYHNSSGFKSAAMGSSVLNFSNVGAAIPNPSDMANCAVCPKDTFYYCQGAPSITLTTSLAGTITWALQSGNATITGSGQSVSVTATDTSIITAASSTIPVVDTFVVVPVPAVLNAGNDFAIGGCNPFSDSLRGTLTDTNGNFTYSIAWAPLGNIVSGGTTMTPVVSQNALTTYTVSVTTPSDEGGCLWQDSVVVDIDDYTPIANFDFDAKLGCSFDTVVFTNTSTVNPNGNPTYFWTFGDGNFSSQSDPTHFYGVQGSYNVILQVNDNGCTDDTTITVDVRHPLSADFLITNTGTAGDDSICLSQSFIFSPATTPLPGNSGLTFDWYFGDGNSRLGEVGSQQIYQYLTAGTFQVKMVITDTIGCKDSVVKTVFVDIPAYLEVSASPLSICVGEQVYFIDSVSPNTFNVVYDFDDGNVLNGKHNPVHTFETSGTYNVEITAQYLVCPNADTTIAIQVSEYPLLNLGEDKELCPGLDTSAVLQNIENPSQILTWSTGVQSPSITVGLNETGRYWASVDNNGCSSTDSIWIKRNCYLNIPNSFSPNGDGRNDYFIPREILSSGVQEFDMKIFNRWGELIFESNTTDGRGWDGSYGGKEQPVGVYIYMINAQWENGFRNSFTGNMTLVR